MFDQDLAAIYGYELKDGNHAGTEAFWDDLNEEKAL
jgi:hypothetical protein